jgi:hypothetical protein
MDKSNFPSNGGGPGSEPMRSQREHVHCLRSCKGGVAAMAVLLLVASISACESGSGTVATDSTSVSSAAAADVPAPKASPAVSPTPDPAENRLADMAAKPALACALLTPARLARLSGRQGWSGGASRTQRYYGSNVDVHTCFWSRQNKDHSNDNVEMRVGDCPSLDKDVIGDQWNHRAANPRIPGAYFDTSFLGVQMVHVLSFCAYVETNLYDTTGTEDDNRQMRSAVSEGVISLLVSGQKIVAENINHLIGATDITFQGIGPVKLGMTGQQLAALGYRSSPLADGCVGYEAAGKPYATLDPTTGGVVQIFPDAPTRYQTLIGGIRASDSMSSSLSSLSSVETAFANYPTKKYFNNDFGEGSNGLAVTGPKGGTIMFFIQGTPSSDGLNTISGIGVGIGVHATRREVGCS